MNVTAAFTEAHQLPTADRHFDGNQRVWHIGCFTWANKLISSWSIKEIFTYFPTWDNVAKPVLTPVFCLSVWCGSVSAGNNRFKVNTRKTVGSRRLTNYSTMNNHTRFNHHRHTQNHHFRDILGVRREHMGKYTAAWQVLFQTHKYCSRIREECQFPPVKQ